MNSDGSRDMDRTARIRRIRIDLLKEDQVKESLPNSIQIFDGALSVYTLSAGENLDTGNLSGS